MLKHFIFWTVFILFNLVKSLATFKDKGDVYTSKLPISSIIGNLPDIITAYIVVYIIFEKLIKKRKYLLGTLSFFIVIYIMSVLNRLWVVQVVETIYRIPPFEQESFMEIINEPRHLIAYYMPSLVLSSFVFAAVKYYFENEGKHLKQLEIEKEKSSIELKTLKGQLNPHFLFNTLNNIYSLSVMNSPQTSNAIAKLSEMLDFVLFKCDDQLVSLKNELALIRNYIALEKLRYTDELQINITSDINVPAKVPPLILLSLVENAFKHGASANGGAPEITIDITSNEKTVEFFVSNTVSASEKTQERKSIGLLNIKKQLDLIYGTNYTLDIDTNADLFSVKITIQKNVN
ncbi:sensor histidine kinase [Tenacibaculum amylolyticum]|uniref:sensor histidine kinase n=1 Tax=Tenacibaculum amylolyticum TaxID=104269 RepID=UPI0038B4A148